MRRRRLNDGAHDERPHPELVHQVVPVHLDVSPRQLGPGRVPRDGRQHGGHVLRPDALAVQRGSKVSGREKVGEK